MLSLVERLQSCDGTTVKYVWALEDGNAIESVYLEFEDYDSICVSSQVGCDLRCVFCATGLHGLVRNLTTNEIIAQVENVFEDIGPPDRDFQVAFMGMGEPLLNLDSVSYAQEHLRIRFPGMRFSLSTAGIAPKIYELAKRSSDVQLQISLHASNDDLRKRLMPIAKEYSIKDILEAARYYAFASNTVLRISYLLLNSINDSDAHADELAELIKDLPAYLKICKFNPVPEIALSPASDERYKAFEARCSRKGLSVYQFSSIGLDIGSGCGQLRPRRRAVKTKRALTPL